MSNPETSSGAAAVAMRFEVTALPVADDDRAKAFYEGLGWRLDADFPLDEHYRILQFTPPGSAASIQFGKGTTTRAPGSMDGLYLIVDDLEAARQELDRPRCGGQRHLARARTGDRRARAGPRPGGPFVQQLRVVPRSRRQRLAAPGAHGATPGPGVTPTPVDQAGVDSGWALGRASWRRHARADPELAEHLAQVPFDGAGAEEQPGADLRVGQAVAGQAGDLLLLGRELVARLDGALAHLLARRQQLAARALGERLHADRGEHARARCAAARARPTRRPSRRSHSP